MNGTFVVSIETFHRPLLLHLLNHATWIPSKYKELKFRTSRSSGSGGQNVNKVETRVEALLEVSTSEGLNEEEKAIVATKLASRIAKKAC